MYHSISVGLVGYCDALDFTSHMEDASILVMEDLKDALPYLYEKHFGVPYRELGWWLEPGAKEFVADLEHKWLHNELDLSEVYKDPDFLAVLAGEYNNYSSADLDDFKEEIEDEILSELYMLSNDELKDLYEEYGDDIDYTIYDSEDNAVGWGSVLLPELEEDEEEDEDEDDSD